MFGIHDLVQEELDINEHNTKVRNERAKRKDEFQVFLIAELKALNKTLNEIKLIIADRS